MYVCVCVHIYVCVCVNYFLALLDRVIYNCFKHFAVNKLGYRK